MTLLTIEQILAADDEQKVRPAGYEKIQKFCDVVDAGEIPDSKLLADVAAAFKGLLENEKLRLGLSAFGEKMGLHDKPGAPAKNREFEVTEKIIGGFKYLRLRKEYKKLKKPRAAELAVDMVAIEYDDVHPNTIKNWAEKYIKEIDDLEAMVEPAESMLKWLSLSSKQKDQLAQIAKKRWQEENKKP